MRAIAVVLLSFGTLIQAAAGSSTQGALPVTGTVLDYYLREPVGGLRLRLIIGAKAFATVDPSCARTLDTTTAQDGSFRFDIPLCAVRDHSGHLRPICDDCRIVEGVDSDMLRSEFNRPVDLIAALPLTIFVADDVAARRRYEGVCAGRRPDGPAPPVLMIVRQFNAGGWYVSFMMDGARTREKLLPWPAVLCLSGSHAKIGSYRTLSGQQTGDAYRTLTLATVVRWTDGKRFHTSVTAEPPTTVSEKASPWSVSPSNHSGDPWPQLHEWLEKVAARR